jgi:hypothetical protein
MPWKIVLHAERPEDLKVGDMYPAPWLLRWPDALAPRYHALPEPRRAPLVVRLPGPVDFCIDAREWNAAGHYGDGWGLSGEAPGITLTPSINIGGMYHGWIRDGVITEDCEGRRFPDVPRSP